MWLALDAVTREIVGVYFGARDEVAAHKLWQSLPAVYRQCAIAYTDFWTAYAAVLPSKRHRAVGKETGKTSYIERFNNTLRQRVSRLVRKTLSFSKSLENHIGAIWYFIHAYNKLLLLSVYRSTVVPIKAGIWIAPKLILNIIHVPHTIFRII